MVGFRKVLLASLVVGALISQGTLLAQETPTGGVYSATLKGTIVIQTNILGNSSIGTGWIIDRSRRLVVTNHHVVQGVAYAEVFFPMYKNGKPVSELAAYKAIIPNRARVIDSDEKRDLALLQLDVVPSGFTELKMAADSPGPGDRVHSIGNPVSTVGGLWVYTPGNVRAVMSRKISLNDKQNVEARMVDTTSPVNPGDSGGPVVNDAGEIVGVTSSFMIKGRLVSHCIDVTEVRSFMKGAEQWLTVKTADDYKKRAAHYEKVSQYALAVEDYTAAIRLDPKDAFSYRKRGFANGVLARDHNAIADFVIALRLDPKDAFSLRERGIAFFHRKEDQQAIADLTEALKLAPKDAVALRARAHAYHVNSMATEADKDLAAAMTLEPKNGANYCMLSQWSLKAGDFALALKAANQAIDCGHMEGYLDRGHAYGKSKSYDSAIADYNVWLKQNPFSTEAYMGRGDAFRAKKVYSEAVLDYTDVIAFNPRHAVAYRSRSSVFILQKRYNDALQDGTRAIELDPQDGEAYLERGRALFNLNRIDDAVTDLKEAVKLLPKSATAYNQLGITYARKKDDTNAGLNYEMALKLNPKEATYHANRGMVHFRLAEYDEAISCQTKAIELRPTYAIAYMARGRAYEKKGDADKARQDFETAKKFDPAVK